MKIDYKEFNDTVSGKQDAFDDVPFKPAESVNIDNISKESKGLTSDIDQLAGKKEGTVESVENQKTVLDTVLADPELRAFISIARDAITRSGFHLIGKAGPVKKNTEKLRELRFRKRLKHVVADTLVFKHAFMEIIKSKTGNSVSELHVLDPSEIKPVMDLHGKILFWYQNADVVASLMGRGEFKSSIDEKHKEIMQDILHTNYVITWEVDEIAHIIIDEMSHKFWGVTDIETLKNIIEIKNLLMGYIKLLFEQNWFRIHFHGKNVESSDYQGFIDMFRTAMSNPEAPLATIGVEDLEGKRYLTEDILIPLIALKNQLRNEMLTLLRIPPIIAGTVDNSNRSNSDVQAHFAFNNRVRSIQEDLEDDLDFELLSKIGMDNTQIKFNEVSNRDLREIVDIMMLFLGQQAKPEVAVEWARSKGYDIPEGMFPTSEEMKKMAEEEIQRQEGEGTLPPNSNLQPSRKKQDAANKDGFGTPDGKKVSNNKEKK